MADLPIWNLCITYRIAFDNDIHSSHKVWKFITISRDFSSSPLIQSSMREGVSTVTNNGEGYFVYCTNTGRWSEQFSCISYENGRWHIGNADTKCK